MDNQTDTKPPLPKDHLQAKNNRHARVRMSLLLIVSDSISLTIAGLLAVGLRYTLGELVNPPFYWRLLYFIPLFLLLYTLRGLYPAVGLGPVEELRRLSTSTSLVFLFLTAFTFWVRSAELYSRLVFAFAWIFALFGLPLGRWLARAVAIRLDIWGESVAIIGCGPMAQKTACFLLQRSHFGLHPAIFIDFGNSHRLEDVDLPTFVFGETVDIDERLHQAGIHAAIMISGELPPELQEAILNEQYLKFKRLILVSDLSWIGSLGVNPYDMEGLLGLEVRQNLLDPWEQRLKRLVDLLLSVLFGLVALPFMFLIALMVRLDSPGSIFFSHFRIGKSGKPIMIWKFRTMVMDADQKIQAHLAQSPEARQEWLVSQKLKDDPRITQLGQFLRRYSLDEIPQIWNVIRGEMSLVGPRPIVTREIDLYKKGFTLYQRVAPGITGLWQVSGRNDIGYDERVRLDEYYVRNWSIWLDIYILARTIAVVLQRKGAY